MTRLNKRHAALLTRFYAPAGHELKDTPVPKERKPRTKRNAQPEQILQIQCVKLLRSLPSTLCFSVPNSFWMGRGGSHGQKMGYMAKMKATGLTSGVSDLVIVFRNIHGQQSTCFAELKSDAGRLSDDQKLFLDQANAIGCYTSLVKSLSDLASMLKLAGHVSFQS